MKTKVNAPERQRINKVLCTLPTYWNSISLSKISEVLQSFGIDILQEDGTKFEGFLFGNQGRVTFDIGRKTENGYDIIETSMLLLSWYRLESNRYEVTVYLT